MLRFEPLVLTKDRDKAMTARVDSLGSLERPDMDFALLAHSASVAPHGVRRVSGSRWAEERRLSHLR